MNINNKINGLIYGQALGDAIGLTTEFMNKDEVIKTYGLIKASEYNFDIIKNDFHRSIWKKGDWTDDTDQFLLIMQCIIENKLDIFAFAKKLDKWLSNGFPECNDTKSYGVGNSLAIWWGDNFILTDPILAGLRSWIYNPYYPMTNSSNGSVMRTSILGIIKNKETMIKTTIYFSAITHPDPSCIISCLFVTNLIHKILYEKIEEFTNETFEAVLLDLIPYFKNYCSNINFKIKNWSYQNTELDSTIKENINNFVEINYENVLTDIRKNIILDKFSDVKLNENIGHCFKPIACLCIILKNINKSNYLESIINLMMEGGDADTNCAIVGSVIGSFLGFHNLPKHLIDQMPYLDFLNNQVLKLNETMHL